MILNNVLDIIEKPVNKWDIFIISWYPWTWKTLVSWMKFNQSEKPKLYLTYTHMLVAYTRQWLWVRTWVYVLDKWLQINYSGENLDGKIDLKRPIRIKDLKDDDEWTILFIDEVQDISPVQMAELTLKYDKVVICWDRDQVIYRSSNAGIDYFREYIKALERLEPDFYSKRRLRWPYELKKNYRNTKPVFDFAKCFHPDSMRLFDMKIMKQWWEKPELWTWDKEAVYKEVINYSINEIQWQRVVGIITERSEDVVEVKNKIELWLREKLWDKYKEWMVCYFYSEKWMFSRQKESECDKCMNASVLITTIQSMKWLEADDIIMWKMWLSAWWSLETFSRNMYYVWFTRSRDNLIICQKDESFWPFNVPNDLYSLRIFEDKKEKVVENVVPLDDDSDEYDDLPY